MKPRTQSVPFLVEQSVGSYSVRDNNLDVGDSFNILNGVAGKDSLTGCEGNDFITRGDDYDIINGGEGADTYIYDTADFGTDLIEDSTGSIAGITGGAWDTNSLAYAGGGYEYRKYSMGTMTLLGINRKGDAKNTIYIKDWQSGQLGISLSGQEDDPEKPQSSPSQVTSQAGNDVDFILNNDAGDGGQGNDYLQGTAGQGVLSGGAGNDVLNGAQQNTTNSIALRADNTPATCSKRLKNRTTTSKPRCSGRKYKSSEHFACIYAAQSAIEFAVNKKGASA